MAQAATHLNVDDGSATDAEWLMASESIQDVSASTSANGRSRILRPIVDPISMMNDDAAEGGEFHLAQYKSKKRSADSPVNSSNNDAASKRHNTNVDVAGAMNLLSPAPARLWRIRCTSKGLDTILRQNCGKSQPSFKMRSRKICQQSVDTKLWKFSGESLRIITENQQQKLHLLQAKEICGKPVEITPPWSSTRSVQSALPDAQPSGLNTYAQAIVNGEKLGVVYGVPADVSCEDLINLSGAKSAHPLSQLNTRDSDARFTALLAIQGDMPANIQITSFLRLKVQACICDSPDAMLSLLDVRTYAAALPKPGCLRVLFCQRS